jgi:predicted flap endonuclease-1-like 5' DNA nuclease
MPRQFHFPLFNRVDRLTGHLTNPHLKLPEQITIPNHHPERSLKMADYAIIEIEGIGATYAPKLQEVGIKTVADLLERGKTPKGRKELTESTGISDKLILKWVNMSDLFRVKGIGPEYSELLEKAGVDTVKELRHVPEHLHAKLEEANSSTGRPLVRVLPSLKAVQSWVEAAKQLEPVVTY